MKEPDVLPNLLGLKTPQEVDLAAFEGCLRAEIYFTERLSARTKFDLAYILGLHQKSFGHLYGFAGKVRDVNLSKGNFTFPLARFLPESLKQFEAEILQPLATAHADRQSLVQEMARVHAELLFIHPFRDGNGRIARMLANLMARRHGYGPLHYERVDEAAFENYVVAVQAAAGRNYGPMQAFIAGIFPA